MSLPAAIGFFDSGVGGLSVLRHALDRLGGATLLYVADSAYAPYGGRPAPQIIERSRLISRFLLEQGAQAIVVACNTATAVAVEQLRKEFSVPIIAMEPALKPAASLSRSGRIAVLATAGTLASDRYARLRMDHGRDIELHERICHHWVEAVEQGDLDSPRTHDLVNADLAPLHALVVDTHVLGCTHFPFLLPVIRRIVGDEVNVIDPGPAVVEQLCRRLALGALPARSSPLRCFSSGKPAQLDDHLKRLLGLEVTTQALGV
jgi:glutamate racemase